MNFLKGVFLIMTIGLVFSACSQENKQAEPSDVPSAEQEVTDADYVEKARFLTMEGDTVHTSDMKGKVVLIDFWETWCKPCLAIFPTMQKLLKEYPDDFAVLAVNPGFADTKEDAQQFISEHDYDFNYLLDSNNLSEQLGVQSIPFKVFVDAEGNYIKSSLGSYGADKDYEELKAIIEEHKSGSRGE